MTDPNLLTRTATETPAERPRTEVTPYGDTKGSCLVSPAAERDAAGLLVRWAVEIVTAARQSSRGS